MEWSPADDPDGDGEIELAVSDTATLDIFFEFTPDLGNGTNNLGSLFFEYSVSQDAGAPVASVVGTTVALVDWDFAHNPGVMGAPGVQFAAAEAIPGTSFITNGDPQHVPGNPDKFLVGTHVINLDSGHEGDSLSFTFRFDFSGTFPIQPGVLNSVLEPYSYNFVRAASYSTYYAYGKGSPYFPPTKTLPTQPRDPLIIHVVPEPASLVALLALAGVAFLRRH